MRLLFVCICLLALSGTVRAEDHIFNSTTALKEQGIRLGEEALEVVKTPIDIDGYGMIGTIGVAGVFGLTYTFDQDIRTRLQKNQSKTMKNATDIGALVGDPYIHIGIVAAVYGLGIIGDSPHVKEMGEMLGEALFLADATTFLVKQSAGRARPFVRNDNHKGVYLPGQFKTNFDSLPSMHTASSFAMASIMAANSDSLAAQLLYYSAAAFVGFSRVYQDKHWASDVILGAAIGELCGRIVMAAHTNKDDKMVSILPYATTTSGGVAFSGKW